MSFRTDEQKILEKCQVGLRLKIFNKTKLNDLPVYDDRCIKTKIKIVGDKVYTNFRGLKVPEDNIVYGSFTSTSIDSLLVKDKKYYLQVYLDNCTCKIKNKKMADYLDENHFEE